MLSEVLNKSNFFFMVLSNVAVAAANAMRWTIEDADQAHAEGYRKTICEFFGGSLPFYWQHLGQCLESRTTPMKILSGGEIGLAPVPAIDLGEFLLALSLESGGNRRLVVLTNSSRPSLVGVVQEEPQPKKDSAGMTAWDRSLTSVMAQNATKLGQVIE